jgi:hypothetical protein
VISIYDAPGAVSALSSGVAKTVIAITAPAQFGVNWMAYELSFDGSTSTATPARIELCTFTAATAGTPGSSPTIVNSAGQRVTTGFTAGSNYSAEPTVLAPFKTFYFPQYGGTGIVQFTPGQEPDSAVSQGFAIRVTSTSTVNCNASMRFSRC